MKNLYFFTFSYPYSHDFSWKRNELIELQKKFNVTVIPFLPQKDNILTNVPKNVKVLSPILKRQIAIKKIDRIVLLITPRVFYYLREFFRKKVYKNGSWVIEWLGAIKKTEKILKYPAVKKLFKRGADNKNTILYFYWGAWSTLAIPFLKKLGFDLIITRFHGWDLYEYRKQGYITFRTDLLKNIDYAITISEDGANYLNAKYPNINFKTKIIRLGCIKKGEAKLSDDSVLRIVSCSNVIPLKRINLIAEALTFIDFELQWTHFGDGECFDELKNQVLSIPENIKVVLPGRITPDKVLEYYSNNKIDLFLNVSTTEGVPVSIMEAFSSGIPVYATNVGGTSEIVNNINGKLLDKNISSENLANEIRTFYKFSKEKKSSFRKAALETYSNKCNFNTLSKEFINFLLTT